MFKFDFDLTDEGNADPKVSQTTAPVDSEAYPLEAVSEITLDHLLDALPSLISHSPISIPLASSEHITLARRDLFDARFQLIAEGEDQEEESAIDFLDAPSDLVPGLYEGGLKTWECSLDLVQYMDNVKETSGWSGKKIVEIGCGTAVPSLYILKEIFSSPPPNGQGTHIHLQDYNKSVIELVTFPNVVLAWYMSPASLSYRESEPREVQPPKPTEFDEQEEESETLNAILEEDEKEKEPTLPQTEVDPADPQEPGELMITPGLVAAFRSSLESYSIHLRFFSGSWESMAGQNTLGSHDVVLTSETIYRPDALPPLIDLLRISCGKSSLSGSLDKLSLDANETTSMCLVAAKVLYFGVGGGVSEFVRVAEKQGKIKTVWEQNVGVGRQIMSVRWN